jgi:hypothetical protein
MPRDLYDCTAAELATYSVDSISFDTSPSNAATWLAEHGYDAAPVYNDDDPVGFIYKDDVSTEDNGDTLDASLTPFTIDHIISGDAEFTAVLSALIEAPVYFLGGHNQVRAILTRADLNTAPARIYLFDRITYLEEHLRELILDRAPNWKNTPIDPDEIDAIEERHADAQAANVALDEIHYAKFSTLETIVTSVEDCWQICEFSSKGSASTDLHKITELRNDVAHANLLVENTDSDEFLSSGRTTENLHYILETIEQTLAHLQEAGYDPGESN